MHCIWIAAPVLMSFASMPGKQPLAPFSSNIDQKVAAYAVRAVICHAAAVAA
jgi:hypothetical protein